MSGRLKISEPSLLCSFFAWLKLPDQSQVTVSRSVRNAEIIASLRTDSSPIPLYI